MDKNFEDRLKRRNVPGVFKGSDINTPADPSIPQFIDEPGIYSSLFYSGDFYEGAREIPNPAYQP